MGTIIIPEGYKSPQTIRETEIAIKEVKDYFERALSDALNLTRVSAPLFVKPESGLNDNLNGVERPVTFGIKEQEWLTQTLSVARLYYMDSTSSDFGVHTEKSVFKTDSAGFESILVQLALLCTDNTQAACADILSKSTNKTYCRALLTNLTGYDPDGKLLSAIERNAELAGNKDSTYCNIICDSVFSICKFMGRPAYNKYGKDIIKRFMGAGYSSNTRTYARDTLKKIISLEL